MEKPSKSWEVAMRGKDGEWDVTTLHSYDHDKPEEALEDLIIRQSPPSIIKPTKRKREAKRDTRTVVAGDAQMPFHDPEAVQRFHDIVATTQPDNVVILGDLVDLPSASRFAQRPEWTGSVQASIDGYHEFLAQIRANAPDAHIVALEGNHEQRLTNYIQKNAAELLKIKRASQELAVLSLKYLVRMDDLDVEAIEGYPNGSYWIEDNLKAVHGTNTAKGGQNAAKYLQSEYDSTVYGHHHRQEVAYKTIPRRLGSITIAAASPGTLSRIDGVVPGFRHTVDPDGETVKRAEDWQQGVLVIDHNPRVHHIQPVRFTEDGYYLDGKRFE